jgi:hypothetical protein
MDWLKHREAQKRFPVINFCFFEPQLVQHSAGEAQEFGTEEHSVFFL